MGITDACSAANQFVREIECAFREMKPCVFCKEKGVITGYHIFLISQDKVSFSKAECTCVECSFQKLVAHPEAVKQKAVYTFTCQECGKEFTAYGNAKRKYCSHSCYIAARFKGGDV